MAFDIERGSQFLLDPYSDIRRERARRCSPENCKLITSEPRGGVAKADAIGQLVPNHDEELIAGMTETVVDDLKAIHVKEYRIGERANQSLRSGDDVLEPIQEKCSVQKARQAQNSVDTHSVTRYYCP
jgi:hypothetical protein